MTPNQKLNYILHKWDEVPAWTWEGLKIEMGKDKNFNLLKQEPTHHELFLIIEKLIRDKYVEAIGERENESGVKYKVYVVIEEIGEKTYLRRNFDGTVFIDKNGYTNKALWQIINKGATIANIVLLLVIGFFQVRGCGTSSSNSVLECWKYNTELSKKDNRRQDTLIPSQQPHVHNPAK